MRGVSNHPVAAIDFRFRPVGTRSWTRETTYVYLQRMNVTPCPSFEAESIDLMFAEMAEANIELGVIGVPGPTAERGLSPTSTEDIVILVAAHPDRFIGFGSVEPSNIETAVSRIADVAKAGSGA